MKNVYFFGNGVADGDGQQKGLLGGKGANLAEMTNLGIPVPAGFTVTTKVCTYFMENAELPNNLIDEINLAMKKMEDIMNKKFGDKKNPLLVSVRSGAKDSMPGMMETVLNVGLTNHTVKGLAKSSDNLRFAYDSYRRLIMMYADVVMEKSKNIKVNNNQGIRYKLEKYIDKYKTSQGYENDIDLTASDLMHICDEFKIIVKKSLHEDFPDDAEVQLLNATKAVFK